MSLSDLNKEVKLLEQKIEDLKINLELITDKCVTTTHLEVISAKIITDIIKELSEKIDSCPCNKDILENIKNITITEQKTKPGKYSGLKRYSPPNLSTDNPELGSSENPLPLEIFKKE